MNAILNSTIIGEGEKLLIIHGFLGMSDNWRSIARIIAQEKFQVHLLDMRNHGKSFHSDEFSYKIMCDDIIKYLEHHAIESCHFIGHSMGGKVVMLLSTLFPEKTKSITVVDISPKYYPPHHQHILNGLKKVDERGAKSRKEADKILSENVVEPEVRAFLLKNFELRDDSLKLKINLNAFIENADKIGEALSDEKMYKGKALFMKGEKSDYIKKDDLMLIKTIFPKYELKTFPNCGHWLQAEFPKLFIETFLDFYNRG